MCGSTAGNTPMTSKPDRCPECGSEKVASIFYGLPVFTVELERQLKEGEVILGGCCVTGDDPQWHCVECRHQWGKMEEGGW
jgi:primosomal protein N'